MQLLCICLILNISNTLIKKMFNNNFISLPKAITAREMFFFLSYLLMERNKNGFCGSFSTNSLSTALFKASKSGMGYNTAGCTWPSDLKVSLNIPAEIVNVLIVRVENTVKNSLDKCIDNSCQYFTCKMTINQNFVGHSSCVLLEFINRFSVKCLEKTFSCC